MNASHLDFYMKYGISPVRQDISDLDRHFQRRGALYRHLGILPQHIAGRRVCEVGPGSGYNSVFTASLQPSYYELVEGNPTGIDNIRELFRSYPQWTADIAITASRIEAFPPKPFDFVFCEGLLSGVPNPEAVLNVLAACVAPGGTLVITCVDHLSHFPETIRRVFGDLVIAQDDDLDTKVSKILPMVESHLQTLKGMSRRLDDWVIDNLIHPGSIIPLINFPEAVAVLAHDFQFLASSPHFVQDWRWYKDIVGADCDFNINAIEQYWANAHNLMDFRRRVPVRDPDANMRLYDLCTTARACVERFEHDGNRQHLAEFRTLLQEIADNFLAFSPETGAALAEAAEALDLEAFDPKKAASLQHFSGLFGCGTQYISLTRGR
ncbi:MAG: methyltransferase domain-containing protein [Phaeospirillum sp.]|nr:methyltransferase domain-containing protein [Phaeospirillum sp.]